MITYVAFSKEIIFLLSIYDKSEIGALPQSELDNLLSQIK
jgi:hypothetical protein